MGGREGERFYVYLQNHTIVLTGCHTVGGGGGGSVPGGPPLSFFMYEYMHEQQ